jgi:hypothetical protein
MIITGGKYWAAAGSSPQAETSATPAANRMAALFTNSRPVGDLFAGRRDLLALLVRGGNPIWSRPNPSAYSRRLSVRRLATYTAARGANSSAPAPYGRRVIPEVIGHAKRSTAATASRRMCARKSAAIVSVTERACARRGRLPADADATAPKAVRAISRAHHCGAVVAVWPMPCNHRAPWSDAPSVIAAGGAGSRVGFRDLDGEQAKGQQASNNRFHRYPPSE